MHKGLLSSAKWRRSKQAKLQINYVETRPEEQEQETKAQEKTSF